MNFTRRLGEPRIESFAGFQPLRRNRARIVSRLLKSCAMPPASRRTGFELLRLTELRLENQRPSVSPRSRSV